MGVAALDRGRDYLLGGETRRRYVEGRHVGDRVDIVGRGEHDGPGLSPVRGRERERAARVHFEVRVTAVRVTETVRFAAGAVASDTVKAARPPSGTYGLVLPTSRA